MQQLIGWFSYPTWAMLGSGKRRIPLVYECSNSPQSVPLNPLHMYGHVSSECKVTPLLVCAIQLALNLIIIVVLSFKSADVLIFFFFFFLNKMREFS